MSRTPFPREAPAAHERAAAIKAEREQLAERLREASEYQAKYYNQRHAPQRYRVGDEVLLSSKNIRLSRPSKKLDNRFLGPFRIIEAIGKQAYRLDLPKAYSRIHPVFHVSLLEPYRWGTVESPSSRTLTRQRRVRGRRYPRCTSTQRGNTVLGEMARIPRLREVMGE